MLAIVATEEPTIRSEIFGWTFEDPQLYRSDRPIGYTSSPANSGSLTTKYTTVMALLADGFRLIGTPIKEQYVLTDPSEGVDPNITQYSWWLWKEPNRSIR